MKKGSRGKMGMIKMSHECETMNTARVKMLNSWPRLNTEYWKTKPMETNNICRFKKKGM